MDGWLHTGDRGVHYDGRLYVTGRDKALVIKGGQKFHPFEIEAVAARTLGSAVVAFPVANPAKGTEDLAIVAEVSEPAEDAEKRVRCEVLDELGVRADVVRFVGPGTLPRTDTGAFHRPACPAVLEGRP